VADFSGVVDLFAARFDGLDAKIDGDIVRTSSGTMALFPPTKEEIIATTAFSTGYTKEDLENVLVNLSKKFGFPFETINAPAIKWKGKFVQRNGQMLVMVNTAHATKDTPFHEYYHPFVNLLRLQKPETFKVILDSANSRDTSNPEEVVTDYLARLAVKNPTSFYLSYFLQFVRDLLGLKNSLTAYSTVADLRGRAPIDVSASELPEAYQRLDEVADMMKKKFPGQASETPDYIAELLKESAKYSTSDTSSFYQDESGTDIAKRLTAFIGDKLFGEFSKKARRFMDTPAEGAAKNFYKQRGINIDKIAPKDVTQSITIGGNTYSFTEIVAGFEERFKGARLIGKLVHAYIYYRLEDNATEKAKIKQLAVGYAQELGEPYTTLEAHPRLSKIHDNFQNILDASGVMIDTTGTKGIPRSKQDKAAPEIGLVSKYLTDADGNKLGTTADGLFVHQNGDVTLLDWKTGNLTSDMSTPYLMDYGDKYGINDSKLSKGYLELTYRAIMLKEKFPNMKFRSIKLVKVDYKGKATIMELDIQPYLYTIGDYYKQTNPEIYNKLKEAKLLEASSYKGEATSIIELQDSISHLSTKEKHLYLKEKLGILHEGKTKSEIQSDPNIRVLSKKYSDAILELEKDAATDLNSKSEDLSSFWQFKNFSDISNPKVQTLHKIIMDAKAKTQKYLLGIESEHDKLYQAALNKEDQSLLKKILLGGAAVANVYGLFTFSPLWFVGSIISHKLLSRAMNTTTKNHFAFMWRESSDLERGGYYLNLQDTYLKDGVEVPLTQAQKNYRSFVYSTMKNEYDNFANTVVGYKFDNPSVPLFRYEKLGIPQTLPEDFLPRIPKPLAELREEEAFYAGGFGFKTVVGQSVKRNLTNFLEDAYTKESDGLPLKYFKHSGSSIVSDVNHSWNVDASFKYFMASLKAKESLDPVYDIAMGVYNGLQEDKDEAGKPRYDRLVKWLDSQITLQVLGDTTKDSVSAKKITLKANKLTEKLTDIPEGTPIVVSQDRILRALKTSVTYSVLSFKVWSPIRNAVMIAAANTTQSTRGLVNKLMSNILGVPPESFETINIDGGRVALRDYMKAKLLGQEDDSKLWNIAKNFDWLPDNYPFEVNDDRLVHQISKLNGTTNAFLFYQVGETFGALWQLAGLMKSIKVKDASGKEVTLWDAYDNKGNWTIGERGQVLQADGSYASLKELTSLEVKSLKRAYEKLNGSYRKEEKTAIEVSVLGDFVMQFHKYFYQYLKVLFAAPYKDITVGKYVLTGQKPDGMPVYQWHSEVMEGQLRVLVASIFAALSGKGKQYLTEENLGENTLKGHRARALAGLLNTFGWFTLLLVLFKVGLDDDEEKSYVGRSIKRTILDLTRGAHLTDLVDTALKPIVAIDKMGKTSIALFDLMASPVTGNTDRDGWPQGLKTVARAVPFTAGSLQIADVLSKDAEDSEYLFGIIPVRP